MPSMGNFAEILHAASQFTYFDSIVPAYDPLFAYTIFARGKRRVALGSSCFAMGPELYRRIPASNQRIACSYWSWQDPKSPLSVSLFMLGHVETRFQSRQSLTPLLAALNEP